MSEYPSAEKLMAGPLGQWLQSQVSVRDAAREKSNSRVWTAAIILLPIFVFVLILAPMSFELLAVLRIWRWHRRLVLVARPQAGGDQAGQNRHQ